jgi:hypothetical protein
MDDKNNKLKIVYNDSFETLLMEECQKSECMAILHKMAYIKYNFISILLNLPVIILSLIVGFISPINLNMNNKEIMLGSISLFISILKTIDSYYDITKRVQAHQIISLSYSKISNLIRIQLSMERNVRIDPNDLLSVICNDIENLRSSEPIIPNNIINDFKIKYKDEGGAKPNIVNGLLHFDINKNILEKSKIDIQIQTDEIKNNIEIRKPNWK